MEPLNICSIERKIKIGPPIVNTTYQTGENPCRSYLADVYLSMRDWIIEAGFAWEIDWQESQSLPNLTENRFLAESAWVILSSGMRETVVRQRYHEVSKAFINWISADVIAAQRLSCEEQALKVFNHPGKIKAIGSLCERVSRCGFPQIVQRIDLEGVTFLQTFDFIGPITRFHLAKNIGLDVVKPDRHLARMAAATNYSCPEDLCKAIAYITGDNLSTIDLVLWRYATLNPDYLSLFREFPTSENQVTNVNYSYHVPSQLSRHALD
jgi:hypothetical protein